MPAMKRVVFCILFYFTTTTGAMQDPTMYRRLTAACLQHSTKRRIMAVLLILAVAVLVLQQIRVSSYTRQFTGFMKLKYTPVSRPSISVNITGEFSRHQGPLNGKNTSVNSKKGYLVHTAGCKIESLDPFHPSLKGMYKLPKGRLQCPNSFGRVLVSLKDGLLSVDPELGRKWPKAKCNYTIIYREFKEAHDRGFRAKKPVPMNLRNTSAQPVPDEFVQITCVESNGSVVYVDFLTQTNFQNYERIGAEMKKSGSGSLLENSTKSRHKIDEKLNIVMVGVDSTSRLNSHRQLGKVRSYLLDELGAFELLGYNRLGDNTFPNLCPALLGKAIGDTKGILFDDSPFIWKSYQKAGYATLYAHDATDIAPFNYLKKGFARSPVHHYYRPMSYAIKKYYGIGMQSANHCCGRKACFTYNIEYLKQFLQMYSKKRVRSFSFVFNVDMSHDSANTLGGGQDDYFELLQWFNRQRDLRNNSVVVFFSDHGSRYGSMRKTHIGRHATNMPMMFVVFPEWFSRKYPKYADALRDNQRRLTTHYDLHELLRDLCTDCALYDKENSFGVSLLDAVPETRTCSEAGVPLHFCACREDKKLPKTDKNVGKASEAVARAINDLTAPKGVCAVLKTSSVVEAYESALSSNATWREGKDPLEMFTVTVETQPGGGIFEATVSKQGDQYDVIGDISRLNMYGNTSSCIKDDFSLLKLCYCKSNIRT